MSEKQILVLPKNHGLTNADRKALREAGVIVITVRTPHEARLLSAERLPTDSNEMLRQLVKTVASRASKELVRGERLGELDQPTGTGVKCAHYREAHKPRTVTHIPDSSGLTLPQLEAGKQALYACSEDPSFDDVRAVIAAVAQSNPTK